MSNTRSKAEAASDKSQQGYYLSRALIAEIRIAAAVQGCRPCHVVERALGDYLRLFPPVNTVARSHS